MTVATEGIVNIIVKATDQTGSVISNTLGKVGNLAGGIAAAGVAAAGAAGTAIAGVAAKGINDFINFEGQLNEVFTLLPGISASAMDQMKEQVLDASASMGKLPEEIIPSLYSALSAGVPQDNVFEFLEVANAAAVGGVTDLETAVDGITTVVNSFGSDVIGAAEASDLMFTAVRLGKTDFESLSASLSNVTPVAAAMGVNFSDVTAALASMTAQGTPTAQATTQLRSLMVEMGDSASEAGKMFSEVAGQSFQEFIAGGGNVQEALALLSAEADETGIPMQDMFGSIEAGMAALSLSGPNAEGFAANIEAMADSAGATDSAFEVMEDGIGATMAKLKATMATTFIRVGDALSPLIALVGEKLFGALDKIMPVVEAVLGALGGLIEVILSGADPVESVAMMFEGLGEDLGWSDEQVVSLMDSWYSFVEAMTEVITQVQLGIEKFIEFAEPIVAAIAEFVSLQDILIALGIVLAAVIIPIIASLIASMLPIILTIGAIIAIVALVRNAWENNWGGIREKTEVVVNAIRTVIETVMNWVKTFWAENGEQIKAFAIATWEQIKTNITTAIENIRLTIETVVTWIQEFWATHGETIKESINTTWEFIKTIFTGFTLFVQDIFAVFKLAFEGKWTEFGAKLREIWDTLWNGLLEIISRVGTWIVNRAITLVTDLKAKFTDTDWGAVGTGIIQGIADGIISGISVIVSAATSAASAAVDAAKGFLGIESPSKVFASIGNNVSFGLADGIMDEVDAVATSMEGLLGTVTAAPLAFTQGFEQDPFGGVLGTSLGESQAGSITNNHFTLNLDGSGDSDDVITDFELLKTMAGEF